MKKKPKVTRAFHGSVLIGEKAAIMGDRKLKHPAVCLHKADGTKCPTLPVHELRKLSHASALCKRLAEIPEWKNEASATWHALSILLNKVIG
jgi:hypothetical protein